MTNSITNLIHSKIASVSGGIDHTKVLEGALASAAIKAGAYWISVVIPDGKKETFLGELWNGIVKKGIPSFLSIVGVGIGAHYIAQAVRRHPHDV